MAQGRDVIDSVLDMLEESRTAPIFWTRTELLTYLNDGMAEFNLMTGKFQSERVYSLTSNTFQLVPSGIVAVLHISRNNVLIRKETLESLDRDRPTWMRYSTVSGQIEKWGPVGINIFFVYPRPAVSGTSVTLVTLDIPPAIGENTVIPLDEEYVESLTDYVFHVARFKEGGAEFRQSMSAYESFRERGSSLTRRKIAEQSTLFVKEPAAETGGGYATSLRN